MVSCYPLNDLRRHRLEMGCWCDPEVTWIDPDTGLPYPGGALVVHNSADGREVMDIPIPGKSWKAELT